MAVNVTGGTTGTLDLDGLNVDVQHSDFVFAALSLSDYVTAGDSTGVRLAAVDSKFVIFPAGHKHDRARKAAAERYLAQGVELAKMFRTDRGDDEGSKEWDHERVDGHSDPAGDDDVDIIITKDGDVQVAYRYSD